MSDLGEQIIFELVDAKDRQIEELKKKLEETQKELHSARYFPNHWQQPTFMFFEDDGTINFEWCINDIRIVFYVCPKEGPLCIFTSREEQQYRERAEAMPFLAGLLSKYSEGEEK